MHWIASQIKTVRRELGFSQRELAARAGVSSNTLMRIEAGRHDAGFQNIEAIVQVLGYEIDMIKVENGEE